MASRSPRSPATAGCCRRARPRTSPEWRRSRCCSTSSAAASAGPGGACGVRLRVHKQMPLASGLGSSAASSVAGAMAVNELFGGPLSKRDLLAARAGRRARRLGVGARRQRGAEPPRRLRPDPRLRSARRRRSPGAGRPAGRGRSPALPRRDGHRARAASRPSASRSSRRSPTWAISARSSPASTANDLELVGRSIEDRLVEPLRTSLIPGYPAVRDAARRAGALGCSISGSGPSLFAFADSDARLRASPPPCATRSGTPPASRATASSDRSTRPAPAGWISRHDPRSARGALLRPVTFQEALLRGLAPDGGLYLPTAIPPIERGDAGVVARPADWRGRRPGGVAPGRRRVRPRRARTRSRVRPSTSRLPPFRSATASPSSSCSTDRRWRSRTSARGSSRASSATCSTSSGDHATILVATSGDTGSAVAQGFHGVPRVQRGRALPGREGLAVPGSADGHARRQRHRRARPRGRSTTASAW